MSFRPIRYNQGEEIFKLKVEDHSGAYLENWVFMKSDFPKVIKILCKKYGLTLSKISKNKDRDLDWAM